MNASRGRSVYPPPRAVAWILAALPLGACPSPNLYGTTRTVPRGRWESSLAVEGIADVGLQRAFVTPVPPTVQVRRGLGEGVDLGLRLANLTALGADLKLNVLRRSIGLALLPALRVAYVRSSATGVAHGDAFVTGSMEATLAADARLSPRVTPVGTVGLGLAYTFGTVAPTSADADAWSRHALGTQPYARFGAGVQIALGPTVALHPEVTALRGFDGGRVLVSAGLAVRIGARGTSP